MNDTLIRGITKNNHFRIALVNFKNLAEETRIRHNTSPLSTVALTRYRGACLLLSTGLKEKEQYSFNLKCNGVISGLSADVNSIGTIRAYPKNPKALTNENNGKLDIKSGLNGGNLSVVKWIKDQREPYRGNTELVYNTIAKDFTYYLLKSEQIPSAIALGEYINKDGSISEAAGIMIQTLPGATDNEIGFLETTIEMQPNLSEMLLEGYSNEQILEKVFGVMEYEILNEVNPTFKCNCTLGKVESVLISLGKAELENIIENDEETSIKCEYCTKNYTFNKENLMLLLKEAQRV